MRLGNENKNFVICFGFHYLCNLKRNHMRKVIGIGETVLDIIFKNEQPIGAVPGGSVFNGIISLGRAGVNTSFISEAGNDRVGKNIIQFLKDNHVNTDEMHVYPESKSPISLAFLDKNNDAEYLFYKDHSHDQLEFVCPEVNRDDIVMFGSFYAVNPVIRPQVLGFLDYARSHGAILYYDVNFRPSHKNEVMKITPNLLENLEYADFVRGSVDDFRVLYNKEDPDKIYNAEVSFYCKNFICTNGVKNVELRATRGIKKSFPIIQTNTVSTIGAGDNFNAGFIYGLMRYGITREALDRGLPARIWDKIIHWAQMFAANCCQSISNSISPEFGAEMAQDAKGEKDTYLEW